MSIKFEQLTKFLNIFSINIYWENLYHQYQGCNNALISAAGVARMKLIGQTDKICAWGEFKSVLQDNNNQVIISNKADFFEEASFLANGDRGVCYSLKVPLRKKGKEQVVGILGLSMELLDAEDKSAKREILLRCLRAIKSQEIEDYDIGGEELEALIF